MVLGLTTFLMKSISRVAVMGIHRVLAEDIFIVLLGYVVVSARDDEVGGLCVLQQPLPRPWRRTRCIRRR